LIDNSHIFIAKNAVLTHTHREVPALPACIGDRACILYNFGSVVEDNSYTSKYSKPTSIHPIGFSCTRFEYSPVHGRVIRIRCDVLPGPTFAISWGRGVDEEPVVQMRSFDPFPSADDPINILRAKKDATSDMNCISNDSNGMYIGSKGNILPPCVGMSVKVRFDNDWWYGGTVSGVDEISEEEGENEESAGEEDVKNKNTGSKRTWALSITYDDGAVEDDILYPSKDVLMFSSSTVNGIRRGMLLLYLYANVSYVCNSYAINQRSIASVGGQERYDCDWRYAP